MELAQLGVDDRIPRLKIYLQQFNAWEVEELHCVYAHLENMLQRDSRDPRVDYSGSTVNNFALPAPRSHTSAPGDEIAGLGAKAKILSQGLTFLSTYLRQLQLRARVRKEQSLCLPSDEFVISALGELKYGREQFSGFRELVISSDTCPWTDNYGANIANFGCRFFSDTGLNRLYSFAYLRQFGFCIWDEHRLQSWGVLDHCYGRALNKKLMAICEPSAAAMKDFLILHFLFLSGIAS